MTMKTCWIGVALVASVGAVSAQSLADVARKEEARRAAIARPTKVFTERDLLPAESVRAVTPTPQAPAVVATLPDTRGELYWKERMRSSLARLGDDNTNLRASLARIGILSSELARTRGPQRIVIAGERAAAISDGTRWEAAVRNSMRAVRDLEEEARRAGVPPGWLRIQ